ncbi:MAG: hypothetical protein WC749_08805 [Dehalococcoidia bacterium]
MKEKTSPVVNRWQLVRQDDNGNQCVVASFNSKEEAREKQWRLMKAKATNRPIG